MTDLSTRKSFRDGLQFAWNASSITTASECLYKYKLQILDGWASPHSSVHLIFGGHYATALENYHKHIALGKTWEEGLELVVHEALINSWVPEHECSNCKGSGYFEDTEGMEVPCPRCDAVGIIKGHPQEFLDAAKTRENLIRSIVWYVDQYHDEAMKILEVNGAPAAELSFAFEVDDGIMFAGHLDNLVDYAGAPYVRDQKTTKSVLSDHYFDGYKPDIQFSMYTYAGKVVFNTPVKGVIIDAAQIMVGFTRFARGFTFRTDSELSEWYDSSMYTIEAARRATKENHFPRNPTSCGNYGGCPFRSACARSPEVREQFLKADFIKGRRLDPLDQR